MFKLDENAAQIFLNSQDIVNYKIIKVAGDASFRSYYRIYCGNKTFILMFAPPSYEDIKPFIKVDKFLAKNNFSVPKIFAIDEKNGFILLQDFGDDTYSKVLAKTSKKSLKKQEFELYKKATDCLIELHQVNLPQDVALYNKELLLREVMLFVDWYLPLKNIVITDLEKEKYKNLWLEVFAFLDKKNQVLVLRDYHADNLMILKNKRSFRKVGLLDFQDAVIGSKAYDLVSLLEDARRDLIVENRQMIFDYYIEESNCDKISFIQDYAILSLQRNIKILGIFARLAIRDGKNNYLELMPRILDFVRSRMFSNNEILQKISKMLEKFI